MAKTKDKFSGAASNVRPYVERAVSDAELRDNVKAAFTRRATSTTNCSATAA